MICKDFIHIGLGDTGEGIVRYALHSRLTKKSKVKMIDDRAHLSLQVSHDILRGAGIESFPPSFTMVRNPFDWRISFYIHELRMQRFQGRFQDFCLRHRPSCIAGLPHAGVRMIDYWDAMGGPHIDHIGQFEHFQRDFTHILLLLIPSIVDTEEIATWFPQIYGAWSGRPWIENIEQHMRDELYTPDLIERVYEEDSYFFERWGYTFEERYEFS